MRHITLSLMSLYRKYRPKDFPGLIGQEHIKTTLLNAIRAGSIAHAYLFTGPRGTGKTTTARLLAKAINAEVMTDDGRFDGSEIAEEIDRGRLIDVIEIDAASNRGIDEIRDLREKISYAPTRAKNKVYIIDEVHMLTKEAFNALLKTLEEPPSFVFFILATTEIQKVPETIISRCQRFDFRRITEAVLFEHLKQVAELEGIKAEEEALRIVARQARGGARDALTLLEQITSEGRLDVSRVKEVLGISNQLACENLFDQLAGGQVATAMDQLQAIFQSGVDLVQFNRDFLDYLRQKMLEAVKSGDRESALRMIDLIAFFQDAYEKQKFSYIPELPLEVAIAKSCLGTTAPSAGGATHQALGASHAAPAVSADVPATAPAATKNESTARAAVTEGPDSTPGPAAAGIDKLVTGTATVNNLDELLAQWNGVIERVHTPLAKRCLMVGKPVEMSSGTLVLAFQNNFNKDKLFVPELLAQVEKAIEEECNLRLKLSGKVDPSLVLPNANGGSTPGAAEEIKPEPGETAASPTASQPDQLASALNVFGGEVVK